MYFFWEQYVNRIKKSLTDVSSCLLLIASVRQQPDRFQSPCSTEPCSPTLFGSLSVVLVVPTKILEVSPMGMQEDLLLSYQKPYLAMVVWLLMRRS